MKGFIFIAVIYFSVLVFTFLFKIIKEKILKNLEKNKGEDTPSPKIYYVKSYSKKQAPKTQKSLDIAIKGTIINKEKSK